ncbi:unnamed protein product [Linum tenue]|uniref:Uncharacterized protein n=1 Tax=Linum tenue TaxID=586396 RepID=A0AAV0LXV8_9ROSI|nr:unnamed protein product [Linum tenue]
MSVVIPRNTAIPAKMSKDFTTKDDRQTTADIKVGELPKVDITFEIDEDGILKVTAREKLPTAESQSLTITDYKGNLTQQESRD